MSYIRKHRMNVTESDSKYRVRFIRGTLGFLSSAMERFTVNLVFCDEVVHLQYFNRMIFVRVVL